jgi:hypothetical protein
MKLQAGILLVALAIPAAAQFDLSATVRDTLAAWEKKTGIPIHPEANSLIRASVESEWPRLEEFAKLQEPYESSPEPLVRMLVRTYCFDLRDSKLRALGSRATKLPAAARAFQPVGPPPLQIGTSDVSTFSFRQFLAQFFPRLQPAGYLEITSRPPRGEILIDAQPKGLTDRVFVMSPGSHVVHVSPTRGKSCRRSIRIEPGRQASVHCP